MKALVLEEYSKLVYRDVPDPQLKSDEVLIKVRACGICGSDVHGLDGSTGRRRPPVIMGHEAAGEIVEVGPDVTGYAVGDRVTFDSTVYCGGCSFCLSGDVNLCNDRKVLGVSCEEYHYDGAMAELAAVPARGLYPLPDDLSYRKAAMVEPVSIAVHGVSLAPVGLNDSVMVVGCGIIGLLTIQILKLRGCGHIIGVDIDPGRRDLALSMGADVVLDGRQEDLAESVLLQTGGEGVDHAFEVVGNTICLTNCINSLKKGGHVVMVGNISPVVDLPLQAVVSRQLTLHGSCASSGEYGACLDLMAKNMLDIDSLMSAVAPLSDGSEWFTRLHNAEQGLMKVILEP